MKVVRGGGTDRYGDVTSKIESNDLGLTSKLSFRRLSSMN